MKRLAWAAVFALPTLALAAVVPSAEGPPEWAFFTRGTPLQHPEGPQSLEGSTRQYTWAQVDALNGPPDWFPDQHGPMPEIVAKGGQPPLFACALCHLASGTGNPESSHLAGLSEAYIIQQMKDYKSGARVNPVPGMANTQEAMANIGKLTSDEDAAAAAAYFASLKPIPHVKVVEADTVPKTFVTATFMRLASPEGGTEPLGHRIVELPEDQRRKLLRDPRAGTIAYVPRGAVERGRALAETGQCALCHGADLKGAAGTPHIAGSSPLYTVRQLYAFKVGARTGDAAELMQPFTAELTNQQMLEIAAYVATLEP